MTRHLALLTAALVAGAALCGCSATVPRPGTTMPPPAPVASAVTRLMDLEGRFHRLRAFAELLLPLIAPERADQVRAAADRVEVALARIRVAATATDRLFAADEARRALDAYAGLTGG